jgi:hypothetical protein
MVCEKVPNIMVMEVGTLKGYLKSSCKGFTFSWRCVAWQRNEVVRFWRCSILMDDIDIHPWWQELWEIWRHDDVYEKLVEHLICIMYFNEKSNFPPKTWRHENKGDMKRSIGLKIWSDNGGIKKLHWLKSQFETI